MTRLKEEVFTHSSPETGGLAYICHAMPRRATWGSTSIGQEVEEARGKHGLELLLWFLWKGMSEEGLTLTSLEQV